MQIDTWMIIGDTFHFGRHGLGQEESAVTFSSDSLFAALVSRLIETKGNSVATEYLNPFLEDDAPFVISSTFPFAGDIRFYPIPINTGFGEDLGVAGKDLKRISYVSEDIFMALLSGEPLSSYYSSELLLHDGSLLVSAAEMDRLPNLSSNLEYKIWNIDYRPRVTLGRVDQRSTLFFTGLVSFASECGLWFGIRWLDKNSEWARIFEDLLLDLADSGLGGERSAGFGDCRFEKGSQLTLPDPEDKVWVSLSHFLPKEDEVTALANEQAAYRIENVGGWLESSKRSGQRRRQVNFLAEGSVLGPLANKVPGQVVDVRPVYPGNPDPVGHVVLRSGLALGVGMKGGAG